MWSMELKNKLHIITLLGTAYRAHYGYYDCALFKLSIRLPTVSKLHQRDEHI